MRKPLKVIFRYVLAAAGVALFLLLLNFLAMAFFVFSTIERGDSAAHVFRYTDNFSCTEEECLINKQNPGFPAEWYAWSMLLNEDGKVIWSDALPEELPRQFELSDVAVFSRWYLMDYPVYVWKQQKGLFVWGGTKDSVWKQTLEMPMNTIRRISLWVPFVLVANLLAALGIALFLGLRYYRELRPVIAGIGDLAEKRPVDLPVKGNLSEIAGKINRASAELQAQEQRLNKRDSARAEWIRGISHDIRTPLSIVMGYSSQVVDQEPLSPDGKKKMQGILSQSEKIKALVEDLNLASRLEYEMQPLRLERISVAALIRGVVAEWINQTNGSFLSSEPELSVDIGYGADMDVVIADKALLSRALTNLIQNCFTHAQASKIEVSLTKTGNDCQIIVRDDGKGFPDAVLREFGQEQSPDFSSFHGMGMILVQKIIRAHRGKVHFENPPEGGSLTTMELPAEKIIIKKAEPRY